MKTQHHESIASHTSNSGTLDFIGSVLDRIKTRRDNRIVADELTRLDQKILKDIGLERCRAIILKS